MRLISRHISLESFTSRLPGVVPAYVPGSNEPIFFDEESLKEREYEYPSNYGLIPMSVKITDSGLTESIKHNDEILFCKYDDDTEECECIIPRKREDDEDECCITLSWETISDWYHFFTDYYHLLNDWGHCGVSYSSATMYYGNESKNGYADQMKYGSDKQTYIDLDTTFNERGGKIKLDDEYKPKKENGRYVDDGMFKEICNKYIPSMDIPKDYTDYWHTTKLFYPDYIRWKGWFNNRYSKYSGYTDASRCTESTDCCDCAEYFDRGGNVMYDLLTGTTFTIPTSTADFCETNFITDISLQVSIDDMGEFSIFSEEYKFGKDYRTADNYGDTENTKPGTVTAINSRAMTLMSGAGFSFDSKYMEKYFDEDAWEIHDGSKEVDGVLEENDDVRYIFDETPTGYYGFRPDFTKVIGDTPEEVREALAETYDVTPLNAVNVNGYLYDVSNKEYGYYKGNDEKLFYVYREEYTETPYTVINGKRIYADARPQSREQYYYFPFFYSENQSSRTTCDTQLFNPTNYKWFPRTKGSDTINFIIYAGGTYKVVESGVTINGYDYKWLQGAFVNDDGTFYVGKDGLVYYVGDNTNLEVDNGYVYDSTANTVTKIVNEDADVYQYGIITGTGISKLSTLRCNSSLTDDTGEPIEGRYDVSGKTNHQPPEGAELDLMYEKYNIGRMYPVEGTEYYYGDMITDMKFYYLSYGGEIVAETEWSGSSLATIQSMEIPSAYKDSVDSGTVYCDIDYIIGGTFTADTKTKRVGGIPLNIGTVYGLAGGNCSSGVSYHETVKFVRTETQYKLSLGIDGQIPTTINAASSHTLCYPVVCYKLEQDNQLINSDYGGRYTYPVADFDMTLPPTSGWTEYGRDTELFPVFRQEYLFGSATMQKLDVDIYIDRGTNAAFEKHLKLGEVTSMEALEQLGNGYFKMMDN